MFRKSRPKRSGFTLPEVLVTVAIVSVLAAIVVPTVTSQIGKGDDTRLQTTITNVRTGITAFVSDTRRFPQKLSQLYNAITVAHEDLTGAAYSTAIVNRWRGPYASGSLANMDSIPMSLAFMLDSLVDSNLVAGTSGQVIATLGLQGFTNLASIARLDTLIDAGVGAAPDDEGVLQWAPAACNPCTRIKLQLMGSR
jgi:prepilin-type N-terminal cleavage/methylation domain-containing protein